MRALEGVCAAYDSRGNFLVPCWERKTFIEDCRFIFLEATLELRIKNNETHEVEAVLDSFVELRVVCGLFLGPTMAYDAVDPLVMGYECLETRIEVRQDG